MTPLSVTILIFITILIILFILYVFGVFTPPQPPNLNIEQLLHEGEQKSNFQDAVPVNGPRGDCNIYTFPPGTDPTFEQSIVDQLQPEPNPTCVDDDQYALQLVTRTCGRENSGVNGCINYDGQMLQNGEVEELYQPCNRYNPCKDATYAALALNFAPDDFKPSTPCNPSDSEYPTCLGALCLQYSKNSSGQVNTQLTTAVCQENNPNQFFRITRANPPNLETNGGGSFAQIFERNSSLCVNIQDQSPTAGKNIILGPCSPNGGFVWFLAPPVSFQAKSTDPKTITPQQMVYMKTTTNVPLPSMLPEYIQMNKPVSMYPFSSVSTNATMTPTLQNFATDVTNQLEFSYNSQILDTRIYDILAQGGPRIVNGNMNIPYYVWYG